MGEAKEKKIGQEYGEVRQSVDLDALNAYLKGGLALQNGERCSGLCDTRC